MNVEVLVVHPATTIVHTDNEKREIPTAWFPTPPSPGQHWELNLASIKTPAELYARLNEYLSRG